MSESNDGGERQRRGAARGPGPGPGSLMGLYSLGMTIAVGMALFVFGGYALDRRAGGGMRWTLLGAALGIVFCVYEVWRLLRSLQDDDRKEGGR